MRAPLFALTLLTAPVVLVTSFAACSSDDATPTPTSAATTTTSSGSGGTGGMGGSGGSGGTGGTIDPTAICQEQALPIREWAQGPYGTHRDEVADDFTLELLDGTSWNLKEHFSGCETYAFVPDKIPVSDQDSTSVWEKDLDNLLEDSPLNVHYFFISRQGTDETAAEVLNGMQGRIDALLPTLDPALQEHWRAHLHVVKARSGSLDNWIGDVIKGHGRIGFGIDRRQRIRGIGYLSDVKRYSSALNSAGAWPWKSNLAYVAHEPQYWNAQQLVWERLESETVNEVKLWDGEILSEFAETDVDLPSAAEMAAFDTFEVEVTMMCPDPDQVEPGNCGAWDYLAYLFVQDENGADVQLARFITSYHRETHWVVDATPMMVHLLSGGTRHFKWSFAPPWNVQPTATRLSLRFSNKNKGLHPTQATYLWSGGSFSSTYNDPHLPIDVPIPAEAKKVELFTIITGHGASTGQCSEFCNHQHEFTVNGNVYLKEHLEAGNEDGCIAHLENGMVPNQPGTWWFGRGGWCPGQQVDPWVVDITGDVTPGQTATLSYQGLYKDKIPPDGAGDIDMISYVVVYE